MQRIIVGYHCCIPCYKCKVFDNKGRAKVNSVYPSVAQQLQSAHCLYAGRAHGLHAAVGKPALEAGRMTFDRPSILSCTNSLEQKVINTFVMTGLQRGSHLAVCFVHSAFLRTRTKTELNSQRRAANLAVEIDWAGNFHSSRGAVA